MSKAPPGSVQDQMNKVWDKSRPAFFRKTALWSVGIILAIVVTALIFTPSYQIDRRDAPPSAYALMSEWLITPIRPTGIDLTPIHPLIRDAMEDGYVYMGEWKRINRAVEDLERVIKRGNLQKALSR